MRALCFHPPRSLHERHVGSRAKTARKGCRCSHACSDAFPTVSQDKQWTEKVEGQVILPRHHLPLYSLIQDKFCKPKPWHRGGMFTQTGSGTEFYYHFHYFRLTAVFTSVKVAPYLVFLFSALSASSIRNSENWHCISSTVAGERRLEIINFKEEKDKTCISPGFQVIMLKYFFFFTTVILGQQ